MMKLSRPEQYRELLAVVTTDLKSKLWVRGKRGTIGGYKPPANRKRVRALARVEARMAMRRLRATLPSNATPAPSSAQNPSATPTL